MPFVDHDHIGAPPGTRIIWRYMGLDKFLDLIIHQRLFFANVHDLTDQYEASLPANLARKHSELLKKKHDDEITEAEQVLFESMNLAIRANTLVNCWSLGTTESYALWKVYLCGAQAGVAIRTSLSSLRDAIRAGGELDKYDIYIGEVQYTDFLAMKYISNYSLVTIKRNFYKYEKELRLFIANLPESGNDPQSAAGKLENPEPPVATEMLTSASILPTIVAPKSVKACPGRYVNVDIPTLVENLYLSPFMGPWFWKAIVGILEKIQPALLEPEPRERVVMSSILDR